MDALRALGFHVCRVGLQSPAPLGNRVRKGRHALRGASHGAWERIEPDLFAVTTVFFRFNPQTGAYLGTQKVNATVRVAPDGETFAAVSLSELRDPDGNLVVGGLRGTAAGKRIHVERIPDQP